MNEDVYRAGCIGNKMPKPIKVGLLTNADGAHVSAYLQALAAAQDCSKVILGDSDGKWEDAARRTLGEKLAGVYRNHQELLATESPELALITLEAGLTPPVIQRALDANCHVFAEKPACLRARDFEKLTRHADSKHRHLMLALANRSNSEILAARQLIHSGQLGKIYGLEMHLIADQTRLTRPAYHRQWFAQRSRSGGGHLIWLGIHWLDLAMFLTDAPITSVCGFTANVGGQPIDIEDSAAATLQFSNGTLGTLTSGYFLDKGYHTHIKIWGAQGWLRIQTVAEPRLQWVLNSGDNAGQVEVWKPVQRESGYTPFVAAAIKACAENTTPPISNVDSLRALKTVFGIYESAETGRAIQVA